jgi:dTDP-4-amino-4,6-dideoxygalactose transaminase
VFVDSRPGSFNLDCEDAARRITARTKALIPVHLFGQAADMESVMALARQHGLRVIEDAAQALGAKRNGQQVGTIGELGTTSFYPSKNIGALGDAGALLTNDDALYARCRILRMHGMEPKYRHPFIGGNFRLDALQAAFLAVKLPHLSGYSARRANNAALYHAGLGSISATRGENARLILPTVDSANEHIWNQYTLRLTEPGQRDALRAHLASRGISTEIYYPLPLHEQACFADLGYQPEDLPVAHRLAGEVLSLPIFPELEAPMVEGVCRVIAEFFES